MDDNQLMRDFMFLKDEELNKCYQQLDSVHNLNNDSMAIRCAGHKAARIAFVLGFKHAESQAKASSLLDKHNL